MQLVSVTNSTEVLNADGVSPRASLVAFVVAQVAFVEPATSSDEAVMQLASVTNSTEVLNVDGFSPRASLVAFVAVQVAFVQPATSSRVAAVEGAADEAVVSRTRRKS